MGLGNPGAEFAGTRHNLGADTVALLAERGGERLRAARGLRASVAEIRLADRLVALAVPSTYMNESGSAVHLLMRRFGVADPSELVVVHDELDLPVGALQIKVGGGTAGHNGLKSVQAHLHSATFVRVRIGVGKPPGRRRGADHVLARPAASEREALATSVAEAADAVELMAAEGVPAAMNRFNGAGRQGGAPPSDD